MEYVTLDWTAPGVTVPLAKYATMKSKRAALEDRLLLSCVYCEVTLGGARSIHSPLGVSRANSTLPAAPLVAVFFKVPPAVSTVAPCSKYTLAPVKGAEQPETDIEKGVSPTLSVVVLKLDTATVGSVTVKSLGPVMVQVSAFNSPPKVRVPSDALASKGQRDAATAKAQIFVFMVFITVYGVFV